VLALLGLQVVAFFTGGVGQFVDDDEMSIFCLSIAGEENEGVDLPAASSRCWKNSLVFEGACSSAGVVAAVDVSETGVED